MAFTTRNGTRGARQPRGRLLKWMNKLMIQRIRKGSDPSVLVLTTVGRRSGAERQSPVTYFPDHRPQDTPGTASAPGASDAGVGDPNAGDPSASSPGMGDPNAANPSASGPGVGDPNAGDPGASGAGVGDSGLVSPGVGGPSAGNGGAAVGSSTSEGGRRVGEGRESWLIVASAAGAANNPAWYHNLSANPERASVVVGGRTVAVVAEELEGAERELAWERISTGWPRFAQYQDKTDRRLPVIRLTAR